MLRGLSLLLVLLWKQQSSVIIDKIRYFYRLALNVFGISFGFCLDRNQMGYQYGFKRANLRCLKSHESLLKEWEPLQAEKTKKLAKGI